MLKKILLGASALAFAAVPSVASAHGYWGRPAYGYSYGYPAYGYGNYGGYGSYGGYGYTYPSYGYSSYGYGYPAYGYSNYYGYNRCNTNAAGGALAGGAVG